MIRPLTLCIIFCAASLCALAQSAWYGGPFKVGVTPLKVLQEASGIIASATNPDIIWMHNDSGDEPTLYAVSAK